MFVCFALFSQGDFYRLQLLQTLPSTKVAEAVEGVALRAQSKAAKEVIGKVNTLSDQNRVNEVDGTLIKTVEEIFPTPNPPPTIKR